MASTYCTYCLRVVTSLKLRYSCVLSTRQCAAGGSCGITCGPDANMGSVSIVDSSGPKDAQVRSYSPGGANVPLWKDTLPSHVE